MRTDRLKSRLYYAIPFALFIGIAFFFWQGLGHDPHQLPSALIDKPLPVFQVPSLFATQTPLRNTDFHGKVALLHVFASWCETCREEGNTLLSIAQTHRVVLYGLNYKDQKPAARAFLQRYGNPYHAVGFDAQGIVGMDLGVYGTPETFLIDDHGIIRYKYIGPITPETWETILLPQIQRLKNQLAFALSLQKNSYRFLDTSGKSVKSC